MSNAAQSAQEGPVILERKHEGIATLGAFNYHWRQFRKVRRWDAICHVDQVACRTVGVRSMICVPLLQTGVPVGVLKVMGDRAADGRAHF